MRSHEEILKRSTYTIFLCRCCAFVGFIVLLSNGTYSVPMDIPMLHPPKVCVIYSVDMLLQVFLKN